MSAGFWYVCQYSNYHYWDVYLSSKAPVVRFNKNVRDLQMGQTPRDVTLASKVCVLSYFSCVWFFVTPWTLVRQALFMGFSRQEYWSGLLSLSLGDLPNRGTEPMCLNVSALAGRFFTTSATWDSHFREKLRKHSNFNIKQKLENSRLLWFSMFLYTVLLGNYTP